MPLRRILLASAAFGLFSGGSLFIAGAAWLLAMSGELQHDIQRLKQLRADELDLSTEVFDRRGEKIGEFAGERRYWLPLTDIPVHVTQAFLSAEDKDFRSHWGVDPVAIVRSALANLRSRGIRQGASTVTQQLVRVSFLDPEKTWTRKIKEAAMALVLERHLSKDEILELYLNKIYLGNRSYGIESAARNYFRKNARDLSIGEAALLAGLPKAPSRYAPHRYPDRAHRRQTLVLRRMAEDGYISRGDADAWTKRKVAVARGPEDHTEKAPYFIAAVQRELQRKFEPDALSFAGLRIHTTLDARLQMAAGKNLRKSIAAAKKQAVYKFQHKGQIEGAILSLDPRTGAVLAMQGGGDFDVSQFNRTEHARRRLGPMFIPFAVSLALERGHTLATPVGADPLTGGRAPAQGVPTLYEATLQGLTMETARLYAALGGGSMLSHAKRMGLAFERDDAMIALGYGETTPVQLAAAYAAFLNGGALVSPFFITRIEDRHNQVVYRAPGVEAERVLKPQTAFMMRRLLEDVVSRGVADGARGVSQHAAGMSGATDDLHNAWFAGGVSNLASVVWLGAERGEVRLADSEAKAADLAERLWAGFMRDGPSVYLNAAGEASPPEGLMFAPVAGATRPLPFLSGTEPGADAPRRF